MALQKHKIPLSLSSGMDTKTDEFNAISFKLVENLRYNKIGALNKVPGYTAYSTSTLNLGSNIPTISSALSVYSFKDELLLNTPEQLLSYSSTYSSWISKNYYNVNSTNFAYSKKSTGITFVNTTSDLKFVNMNSSSVISHFVDTTYEVSLSSDPDVAAIRLRVDLLSEDSTILNSYIPDLSTFPANVLSNRTSNILGIHNQKLYIACFLNNATNLLIYIYDLTLPNSAPTTVSTDFDDYTNGFLDSSNSYIFLVGSNGTTVRTLRYTIGSGTIITNSYTAPSAFSATLVDNVTSTQFRISSAPVNNFQTVVINKSDLSISGSFTTVTTANESSAITANDGSNTYFIYQDTAATSSGVYVKALAMNNSTNVLGGTFRIFGRNVTILNKALYDSGYLYIPAYTLNVAGFITTFILRIKVSDITMNSTCDIIAKHGYLSSWFTNYFTTLQKSGDILYIGTRIISEDFSGVSALDPSVKFNMEVVRHDLSLTNTAPSIVNNQLIIPSSVPKYYDSETLTEYGFLDFPSKQTTVTQNTAGSAPWFTTGTYGYAIVYSWVDNNGFRHNSAPTFFSVVISAGNIRSISFNVFNLALTIKENVYIDIYRTLADETVYFKAANNILNKPFDFTTTVTITAPDSSASDVDRFETLYTISGELENDPPDPAISSTIFKNRVFLANPKTIEYSKIIEQGKPIQFNASLFIKPDSKSGDIVGIMGMDNVLVIFKENSILIQSGEGPNNLGQQDDYGIPQEISSDVGCVDSRSIVLMPEGVMFKSEKGIYLLNRGLYVSYIGSEVEDYNSESIVGSQLLNNTNEVRFLTSTKILSYDYFSKKWSVFSNINSTAIDSIIHNNAYHYLKSNGVVYKQNDSIFTNNGSYYAGKFETNWITVGSINVNGFAQNSVQGFQRLYTINLLGKYKSAHELKVSLAYDYSDTVIDYATIVPTGTGVYQFEVKPSRQKCEAFKIIVEDQNQSGTGESMVISHILLEVGIRDSAQKTVSDSNRFPAT